MTHVVLVNKNKGIEKQIQKKQHSTKEGHAVGMRPNADFFFQRVAVCIVHDRWLWYCCVAVEPDCCGTDEEQTLTRLTAALRLARLLHQVISLLRRWPRALHTEEFYPFQDQKKI